MRSAAAPARAPLPANRPQVDRGNALKARFKLPPSGVDALPAASEDAALRLALWRSRQQLQELAEGWKAASVAVLDTAAVEDAVARWVAREKGVGCALQCVWRRDSSFKCWDVCIRPRSHLCQQRTLCTSELASQASQVCRAHGARPAAQQYGASAARRRGRVQVTNGPVQGGPVCTEGAAAQPRPAQHVVAARTHEQVWGSGSGAPDTQDAKPRRPGPVAVAAPLLSTALCRSLLPVVAGLRNPALKERHWARAVDAVAAAGGGPLGASPKDPALTLQVGATGRGGFLPQLVLLGADWTEAGKHCRSAS